MPANQLALDVTALTAAGIDGVDPFDQPGVEEAKRLAFVALGRPGYEALGLEMSKTPGLDPRYVL